MRAVPPPGAAVLTAADIDRTLAEANECLRLGRLPEAGVLYSSLLEYYPESIPLLLRTGSVHLDCGRNESARDLFRRVLEIDPEDESAKHLLGMTHWKLGEESQAIEFLHGLTNNAVAQFLLGNIHMASGDYGAAVVALSNAQRLGAPEADDHLALSLLRSGDKHGAEVLLRKLVSPDRQCTRSLAALLGKLLIEDGRVDEARSYFTALIQRRPEIADVAITVLADTYLAEGKLEQAMETLRPAVRSNWSRTFICASLAQLGILMRDSGAEAQRRPHPFPGSNAGVSISSLERYGRFGHQLLEYLFLRWQADATGVVLETPDWVGQVVFELDDPYPAGPRRVLMRSSAWIEEQVSRRGAQALAGYDFFSPGHFTNWQPEHVALARRLFQLRPCWRRMLEPPLAALRGDHQTLIAIHVRRTDLANIHRLPECRWYLDWLRQAWSSFADPLLYIASDDLDSVLSDFREFSPVCIADLPGRIAGLEWLHDFHAIMNADVVATSQSGFSYVASMLNTRAKVFKQPDMTEHRLVDYLPARHNATPVMR